MTPTFFNSKSNLNQITIIILIITVFIYLFTKPTPDSIVVYLYFNLTSKITFIIYILEICIFYS